MSQNNAPILQGRGLLPPHYNAGDRRSFHLRVGTEKQQRGGNKLRSTAALSVTVNRATSPEGRGFIIPLTSEQKRSIYSLRISRKTNWDINILP